MREAAAPTRKGLHEYLIEVPHSPEECAWAHVATAESEGRISRTYRGCRDSTHTTWIVAELASEEAAWSLVPALLRDTARVTRVDRSPAPTRRSETEGGIR
jgi:hypothetical protein